MSNPANKFNSIQLLKNRWLLRDERKVPTSSTWLYRTVAFILVTKCTPHQNARKEFEKMSRKRRWKEAHHDRSAAHSSVSCLETIIEKEKKVRKIGEDEEEKNGTNGEKARVVEPWNILCHKGNNPRYGKASDGFSAPYVVLYGYPRTKEYHVGFPLYRLLFNELYRRGKLVLVANLAPKIVSPCMPCNCLITNKCVRYPAEFLFVLFDCVFWLFIPKSDGLFIFHRGERFAWSPKT